VNRFLQLIQRKEEVDIDWAYRVLINSIRQRRMLKMMAIADDRHFSYDNEIELVQFIASEMQKEGLDVNNEENLDRCKHQVYLTAINQARVISLYCRTFAMRSRAPSYRFQ
jgi:hypothetical protein